MKEIITKKGFTILVDDEDYDFLIQWKWYERKEKNSIYAISSARKNDLYKNVRMHQLLLGFPNSMIDHKDCNGLNNQRSNLRLTDYIKNGQNRRPNKGRRYKGVRRSGNKYTAVIYDNKVRVCIGTFDTEERAAIAYNNYANKHFNENARINIIYKLPLVYKIMSLA